MKRKYLKSYKMTEEYEISLVFYKKALKKRVQIVFFGVGMNKISNKYFNITELEKTITPPYQAEDLAIVINGETEEFVSLL